MSMDITENALMKAGFRRQFSDKWRLGNVTIDVVHSWNYSNRSFICNVYTEDGRFMKAMLPVDTVEQFNRFMELADVELRLEEE